MELPNKSRQVLINQILGISEKVYVAVNNDLKNEKGEFYYKGKYYTEGQLKQKFGPGLTLIIVKHE